MIRWDQVPIRTKLYCIQGTDGHLIHTIKYVVPSFPVFAVDLVELQYP